MWAELGLAVVAVVAIGVITYLCLLGEAYLEQRAKMRRR